MRHQAIEIIDVLGCFTVGHRSPTLDGLIPLAAAQYCNPFVEGCGAGIQIFGKDQIIQTNQSGFLEVIYGDESHVPDDVYIDQLKKLKQRSCLSPFWYEKLQDGPSWNEGNDLYIWTGHVARPPQGACLVVSVAYNRRISINVNDLVYADCEFYQPLIIKIVSGDNIGARRTLSGEVACLICLKPGYSIEKRKLSECLDQAESIADFLTPESVEKKLQVGPTGNYKRLISKQNDRRISKTGVCIAAEMLDDLNEVRFFDQYVGNNGILRGMGSQFGFPDLSYLLVRSNIDVEVSWDGFAVKIEDMDVSKAENLKQTWHALLGDRSEAAADSYAAYIQNGPPGHGMFNVTPWVCFKSPPGWKSLVDGFHRFDLSGLRGVIWTDVFHFFPMVFLFDCQTNFKFQEGMALGRVIPVPSDWIRPDFVDPWRENALAVQI